MSSQLPLGALRVSHAEREPVVEWLQQAFAEGRLDKGELDLRLQLAMTAKTRADLDAVLADLARPASGPPGRWAGPVHGGPVHGGPVHGGPVHGGPVHGGPVYSGPAHGGSVHGGSVHGGLARGEPAADERVLAALAHALGVVTLFVGPLVMLCTAGRRSAYVRQHAVSALNFQLTLLMVTIVTFGIGGIVYAVAWIVASIAALLGLTGTSFRYPFTLRLVR